MSTNRQIDVRVFSAFRDPVKAAWVRRVARAALAIADEGGDRTVSIVIADDDTLRDLNRRFRGLDEVTDVLSFGDTGEGGSGYEVPAFAGTTGVEFPSLPDEPASLGEVVLSYPLAIRQADEHNVAVEDEAALLIVHGVLHLLGHDHAEPGEEAAMKALERAALDSLNPSARSRGPSDGR